MSLLTKCLTGNLFKPLAPSLKAESVGQSQGERLRLQRGGTCTGFTLIQMPGKQRPIRAATASSVREWRSCGVCITAPRFHAKNRFDRVETVWLGASVWMGDWKPEASGPEDILLSNMTSPGRVPLKNASWIKTNNSLLNIYNGRLVKELQYNIGLTVLQAYAWSLPSDLSISLVPPSLRVRAHWMCKQTSVLGGPRGVQMHLVCCMIT